MPDSHAELLSFHIETAHFSVFYDEADKGIIDRIVSLIDETYDNIIQRFNLAPDSDKFSFMLCPSVQVYKTLTHKSDEEYQTWMVGNAEYERRTLCILSPNVVTDRSFDDMLSVIRHEVIHIAFDQLESTDTANLLLAEGIAVFDV